MTRADAVLAAVQQIHEAPLAPGGWARALSAVAHALGSEHGILLLQNARHATEFAVASGMTSEQMGGFATAAEADGRFWPAVRMLPAGSVAPTSALLPDRDYARTVFYNEGVRPLGAFYGLMVSPLNTPHMFVHLSTGRRLGRADFDAGDMAAMRLLVPHLVTALRVGARLAGAEWCAAGAGSALDRLDAGVMLADAAARILFANRTAEAFLAGRGGLSTESNVLCAESPGATQALHRLIAGCADISLRDGGPGGSLDLAQGPGRGVLHVVVAPFRAETAGLDPAGLGAGRPVAILTVTDSGRAERRRKLELSRRYGLTAAEADVAVEIAKGDGREAAAARLGISATTVRTHLSHIFEKTGVHRQAELVRLLLHPGAG